ncbi:PREDICTED: tumor necrosis factor receptor superfamily member 25-like, partial [Cariama cristata]|uniref:tumor necrosis factor receptor superfamily member 25-like n=1 Tax=Cariama cristata TaxID=54380 RepID=UPI000520F4BF
VAALETAAATLDRRDKLDPLDPSRGGEEFYQVQNSNRYCRKCPAGNYVAEHCKGQNSSSKCLPCNKDEYIEYPNDFHQVELSPCQRIRDTQCVCRNGTFCSPDHPCEMCQKCRPRDRRCGPPTGTFSGISDDLIITIAAVVAVVLVVLVLVLWKCRRCRSPGGHWDYLVRQLTRYQRRGPGTQDNICNERFSRDQLLPRASGSVAPSAPGLELFPSPPFFDIFAQDVPCKDWKRYGRALGLMENDIALAEMNDRYSLEPFFQMLNTWQNREGMDASVNTLLEALHEINLGGIAEDISSKLVQQGSFQYEAS